MKVLFAVSNEEISEAIVKRYQKQFKEIISYKNVYYFNAILKEIQKDKTYDRIVISEELEAFTNAQYEQIDRFIFDKLDSISDEATDNKGENTPIILICSDRRTTGENMLVKLFGIGVYDALIGSDRGIDQVCNLINKPRSKKEAKQYYKIEADEVNYQSENENDVSEQEIQNILAHYKKLGKNEDKYVASFDNIVAQYNDAQLRIISKFLPLNVRAVLEEKSPKYQQVMSFNNSVTDSIRKQKSKTENLGPSGKLLKPKNGNVMPTEPIIIPNSVNASSVKKLSRKNSQANNNGIQNLDNDDIQDFETFMAENGEPNNYLSNELKSFEDTQNDFGIDNQNIDLFAEDNQQFDTFEKNNQGFDSFETSNQQDEKENQQNDSFEAGNQQNDLFGVGNQQNDLFGAGNQQYDPFGAENQQYDPFGAGNQQYDPFGAGNQQYDPFGASNQQNNDPFGNNNQQNNNMFDNEEQQQYNPIEDNQINKTKTSKKNQNVTEEPAPAPKRRGRPRKNPIKTEEESGLPGFESNINNVSNNDTSFESSSLLPGFDNDSSADNNYNSSFDSDDNMLPGFSDFISNNGDNNKTEDNEFNNKLNNDFGNSQINNDDFGNNQMNNNFNNDFGNSQMNNDFNNDFGNNQMNNNFNNDFGNNQMNNNFNNGYGNNQFDNNQYYNQPNNFGNNQFDNNGGELSRLLTDNKKIVTFVGTSKNGTSFIVNNLAEYASSVGINVAILDTTKNKNSFYIYTKNEEELRQIASKCLEGLINGQANGISVNRNLTVYTSLPEDREELKSVNAILETLIRVHDLVLIDCDFDTPMEFFANSSETYLIQSYDILTIQPLTAFLRELKAHNMLDQNKLKILLNKNVKVRGITDKTIIGGMSKYNDPAMSFMTDLFDINAVKSMPIQFEQDIYTRYLESVINCDVSIKGYSKTFIQTLRDLCGWVYPSIPGNNSYRPQAPMYSNTAFSANMNNTLNQMKRNY